MNIDNVVLRAEYKNIEYAISVFLRDLECSLYQVNPKTYSDALNYLFTPAFLNALDGLVIAFVGSYPALVDAKLQVRDRLGNIIVDAARKAVRELVDNAVYEESKQL